MSKRRTDGILQVRVLRSDRELFHKAAEADNRSLSSWVRDRLLKIATLELAKEKKCRPQ